VYNPTPETAKGHLLESLSLAGAPLPWDAYENTAATRYVKPETVIRDKCHLPDGMFAHCAACVLVACFLHRHGGDALQPALKSAFKATDRSLTLRQVTAGVLASALGCAGEDTALVTENFNQALKGVTVNSSLSHFLVRGTVPSTRAAAPASGAVASSATAAPVRDFDLKSALDASKAVVDACGDAVPRLMGVELPSDAVKLGGAVLDLHQRQYASRMANYPADGAPAMLEEAWLYSAIISSAIELAAQSSKPLRAVDLDKTHRLAVCKRFVAAVQASAHSEPSAGGGGGGTAALEPGDVVGACTAVVCCYLATPQSFPLSQSRMLGGAAGVLRRLVRPPPSDRPGLQLRDAALRGLDARRLLEYLPHRVRVRVLMTIAAQQGRLVAVPSGEQTWVPWDSRTPSQRTASLGVAAFPLSDPAEAWMGSVVFVPQSWAPDFRDAVIGHDLAPSYGADASGDTRGFAMSAVTGGTELTPIEKAIHAGFHGSIMTSSNSKKVSDIIQGGLVKMQGDVGRQRQVVERMSRTDPLRMVSRHQRSAAALAACSMSGFLHWRAHKDYHLLREGISHVHGGASQLNALERLGGAFLGAVYAELYPLEVIATPDLQKLAVYTSQCVAAMRDAVPTCEEELIAFMAVLEAVVAYVKRAGESCVCGLVGGGSWRGDATASCTHIMYRAQPPTHRPTPACSSATWRG